MVTKLEDKTDPTSKEERGRLDDESLSAGVSVSERVSEEYSNSSPGTGGTSTGSRGSDDGINANTDIAVIFWSRWFFIFLLFCCTAVLCGFVYATMKGEESDSFEAMFEIHAEDFMTISNNNVERELGVFLGLSKTVTSFQLIEQENNGTPPGFVTPRSVYKHFRAAAQTTKALVVSYIPRITEETHQEWIDYSVTNQEWIVESNYPSQGDLDPIAKYIWDPTNSSSSGQSVIPPGTRKDLGPIWTFFPPPPLTNTSVVNRDMMHVPSYAVGRDFVNRTNLPTFLDTQFFFFYFNESLSTGTPETAILYPVRKRLDDQETVVGDLMVVMPWTSIFEDVLVSTSPPLTVVISNSCNQTMTFQITGRGATFLGDGDLHDPNYDFMEVNGMFAGFANSFDLLTDGAETSHCIYNKAIFPTQEFEDSQKSSQPLFMTLAIMCVSVFIVTAFIAFDCLVSRRQKRLVRTAQKQHAIVSSLFPKSIQKKLMDEVDEEMKTGRNKVSTFGKAGLRTYLNEEDRNNEFTNTKPIADLFPETTIMFADIVGFTAWASTREPSQVFTLLENIYREFDHIAKRRRVFKVEVVGDCYVAVCGLPDPKPNHALIMAKFSRDCMTAMKSKTQELEVELGPDTTELGLRIGLHSGPVVAGVLRGEKSRFQLFGDTMNTASRMESTSMADCIQVSQETASLLEAAGKETWLTLRKDKIEAKGKGELQTYFLTVPAPQPPSGSSSVRTKLSDQETMEADDFHEAIEEKRNRVAEWTFEVLARLLKEIVSGRKSRAVKADPRHMIEEAEHSFVSSKGDKLVIDEVAEYISLPNYAQCQKVNSNASDISLGKEIMDELRSYVQTIASLYNDNSFHNFEHATHVVMSVNKLLSRIVAPDIDDFTDEKLHDHTYGITSDPLTQFACVFSALIHDVDHYGVPNAQLVRERAPIAILYKGKSVAEQNSFDVAWDLLSEPSYKNLRSSIYSTVAELKRFRQLVVNSVMATDIVDKHLKTLRNNRWDSVFAENIQQDDRKTISFKATIVIEHLIQASDVAHTMQHWHVYRRWNEKFFGECFQAYLEGRAETDPSEDWYKGEIGFFDFYIIPLAKKLKECGVFGVSSDEYLAYATQNRKEWEERGEVIVKEMIKKAQSKKGRREFRD